MAADTKALERQLSELQGRLGTLEERRTEHDHTGPDPCAHCLLRDIQAALAKFPQNALSDVTERHLHRKVARLNVGRPTELTIASGLVGMTRSEHTIDTASDAATDNLAGIRGGRAGDFLLISPDNDARTIVVQHNNTGEGTAGNRIFLDGAADLSMANIGDFLFLKYKTTLDSGSGGWQEITRSDRGGYSELNVCDTLLTLSSSSQDVPDLSVTLPTPGPYLIMITLAFDCTVAAGAGHAFIGVLADSGDTEEAGLLVWQSDVGFEPNDALTVTKFWRVTTTTNNEVFKARARRTLSVGTMIVNDTDSSILAFSIPGGGAGGAHDQAHDHTTADGSGVLTNDEHDGYSQYIEIATPGNPAQNAARLFARANGNNIDFVVRSSQGDETVLASLSDAVAAASKLLTLGVK